MKATSHRIRGSILAPALGRFVGGKRPDETVIVFCRYPEPGKTKTRLIPALGAEGAAEFHRLLTELTVDKIRDLCSTGRRAIEIHYTGGNGELMSQWLGTDLVYVEQATGDLGSRMDSAFQAAFRKGASKVILIGTDITNLSVHLLEEASSKLRSYELVLGPSEDGGYYLIGLKRPCASLFQSVPWGTAAVTQVTLGYAREQGLSYDFLHPLKDVDRPEDLILHEGRFFQRADSSTIERGGSWTDTISVIIPTLNEESNLADTLATVTGCDDVEVVVVDGDSTDRTVEIAHGYNAKVLSGPRGRAAQMNVGALAAHGQLLLFLHADTMLPEGWPNHVRREMQRPGVVAGAFELRIKSDRQVLRLIEALANYRSRRLGIPYGDQGIFTRADEFRALCGFPNLPIMEDFELMLRLRRRGRIAIAPEAALTSARRWNGRGIWATTAINQVIIGGYSLGISPKLLARLYRREGAV